jgi:Trypsin-co-occurring domain 2
MSLEDDLAQDVSLEEVIQAVSEDLLASRSEWLAYGRPPVFELASLDIELSVSVTRSSKKAGGVDLKVVRGDRPGTGGHGAVQRLSLHLTSTSLRTDQEESEYFDSSTPLRPRRDFDLGPQSSPPGPDFPTDP